MIRSSSSASKFCRTAATWEGLRPRQKYATAYHHIYSGGAYHGTESYRLYQASDSRREGDRFAPCRPGSRPARREYFPVHQERTKDQAGFKIPVVITVYADRSFTFVTKTPPTPTLVLKTLGIEKGSGVPNKDKVATITKAQVKEIAEKKMPDLTATTIEAAMTQVAGTCRSMGITVVD